MLYHFHLINDKLSKIFLPVVPSYAPTLFFGTHRVLGLKAPPLRACTPTHYLQPQNTSGCSSPLEGGAYSPRALRDTKNNVGV